MNVILVVFDSLRKDCIGAYGQPYWGKVQTPHMDAFAEQSLVFTQAYPESLPTLPARRALYTGKRVYPFHNADFRLRGDFIGAPGWGPIPEDQDTLAERLQAAGYRTALIADVYHMFKASKNYWRGFDQWLFLRGQEGDSMRSGHPLTQEELDYWLPKEMRENDRVVNLIQRCIMNMHDRTKEEDFFSPRVLREAATWLEQNQDADEFFLTIESFDPHEPWLIPAHYRRMYLKEEGREQVMSPYDDVSKMDPYLLRRTQANYSGSVTQCDRWLGYFMESMRVLGLLDNTMVILTADHGHSIGDRNYMGKRAYPSAPEVIDIPLMVRFPKAEHGGKTTEMFVQHHDLTAAVLEAAGVDTSELDGIPFLKDAIAGREGVRDHVTIGWGSVVIVIDKKWWFNAKVDRTGILLYDLEADRGLTKNVADENPEIVRQMWKWVEEDAKGEFPEWVVELAKNQMDAPGCTELAARR
jgi:arylsulfatase A-like enzyme